MAQKFRSHDGAQEMLISHPVPETSSPRVSLSLETLPETRSRRQSAPERSSPREVPKHRQPKPHNAAVDNWCSSEGPSENCADEATRQATAMWKLVLLGRTFREGFAGSALFSERTVQGGRTVQEAADCLVDVLNLDPAEALTKATKASGAITLVIGVCDDIKEASDKAEILRSRGLLIQVASEQVSEASRGPAEVHKEVRTSRRNTYSDVFQAASRSGGVESRGTAAPPAQPCRRSSRTGSATNATRTGSVNATVNATRTNTLTELPDVFELDFGADSSSEAPHVDCAMTMSGRAEASALLRFLLFGEKLEDAIIPTQPARRQSTSTFSRGYISVQKDASTSKYTATRDQVRKVAYLWENMNSKPTLCTKLRQGRSCAGQQTLEKLKWGIDRKLRMEFCKFVNVEGRRRLPSWAKMRSTETLTENFAQYIRRLSNKIGETLLGENAFFDEEDLLRLVWHNASETELEDVSAWFKDAICGVVKRRPRSPPVLASADYQGFCAVFKNFAGAGCSPIAFEKLVDLGLICEHAIDEARKHFDGDGNGLLDMEEFCEMMCPWGYRATLESKIGTLQDGTRIMCDPKDGEWRCENFFLGNL